MNRLQAVAFLAREPGIAFLRDALLQHPNLSLRMVLTHGLLPKPEGGGNRSEVADFESLCKAHSVNFVIADGVQARDPSALLPVEPLDLLFCVSWRYLFPTSVLQRFRLGSRNLQRGALPVYAGAKPVERAIAAGERRVAITAHEMIAEVDAGAVHAGVWMDLPPEMPRNDPPRQAEIVKRALVPLYPKLAELGIGAKIAAHQLAE